MNALLLPILLSCFSCSDLTADQQLRATQKAEYEFHMIRLDALKNYNDERIKIMQAAFPEKTY